MLTSLSGCVGATGSETSKAICDEWEQSMPKGHPDDTTETLRQIDREHDVHGEVC